MSHKIDAALNWSFSLVVLPTTLFLLIHNFGLDFVKNDFVGLILEFVFVGSVPLIIVSLRGERRKDYGFSLMNWKKSLVYGIIFLSPFMLIKGYAFLSLGYEGWSWNLNPLTFSLYLPVYGPLEAFFIVFSVHKIDRGLSCENLFSWGLILTSILFGSMHLMNYFFHPDVGLIITNYFLGNIIPALIVGTIFKKTKSILGSSLFWTVLNFF